MRNFISLRVRRSFKFFPIPLLVLVLAGSSLLRSRPAEAQGSQNSKLHDLQEQRLATLRDLVTKTRQYVTNGLASADELWSAIKAKEGAELDLCTSDKERVSILENTVAEAKAHEEQAAKLAANKLLSETSLLRAKAERIQQEIFLEQARTK